MRCYVFFFTVLMYFMGSLSVFAEKLVNIPGGDFFMGTDEANRTHNQQRQRRVYVKKFYLTTHEVTNREYEQFILAGGYNKEPLWSSKGWRFIKKNRIVFPAAWNVPGFRQPNSPVVGVSWYEAQAYARWAKKRLPTELEWEKAARGTDGRRYPWGNSLKSDVGYRAFSWPYSVGSFPANVSPYGIYDMAGNVWEWVADWYGNETTSNDKMQRATQSRRKILRGGGWGSNRRQLQVTYRRSELPTWRRPDVGIRLAADEYRD